MDHVAYMSAAWGLLPKILSGQKTTESRWYQTKHLPWDKITTGDTIYFKNSGSPITLKAQVSQVIQFSDLNPSKIKSILDQYGQSICADSINNFYDLVKDKQYCLLVFLKDPQSVTPFNVDKRGFGAMSAWITVPDINQIKLNSLV
jgi:ASC-1-like (ASCH) protein